MTRPPSVLMLLGVVSKDFRRYELTAVSHVTGLRATLGLFINTTISKLVSQFKFQHFFKKIYNFSNFRIFFLVSFFLSIYEL